MMFDGLYASNGTLYVVTDDPALVPEGVMVSTALKVANGPVEATGCQQVKNCKPSRPLVRKPCLDPEQVYWMV